MTMTMTTEKLNLIWKEYKSKEEIVSFYTDNTNDRYCCFSNFWRHKPFIFRIPCGILKDKEVDIHFSEKAIMLCKASLMEDCDTFDKILKSKTPMESKRLGRSITPWNEELWKKNVCKIAKNIIICKFSNVKGLKEILLETGNKLIVEAAYRDRIWGIGMGKDNPSIYYPSRWRGSNILGWALMEARNELK